MTACSTLGISAKALHAPRNVKSGGASKKTRFELLRVAQSLLFKNDLQPDQQKRVVWCNRTMIGEKVPVYRAANGEGSRFSSLHTCGSVWHCPVCAAKIAESRREELQAAMTTHKKRGGTAYLVTLTFPHESDEEINAMLAKFDKARTAFKNCRTYKGIIGTKRDRATGEIVEQGSAGSIGAVSSMEVTFSKSNGWHPHMHMLVFCDKGGLGEIMFDGETRKAENGDLQSRQIDELKSEWVRLLLKNGLGEESKRTDMLEHALNVRGGEYAADYIAKFGKDDSWNLQDELTRSHAKTGAAGVFNGDLHLTPFQLLTWAKEGDGFAMHRFREYADAFQGKRMLTWTPHLRAELELSEQEQSEEDIAAAPPREEVHAGDLSEEQFVVLLTRNALGDFLRYVAESLLDPETAQADIDEYVDGLRNIPPTHGKLHRLRRTFGSGYMVAEA